MTKTDKFKPITIEVFWSQEDEAYIARPIGGFTRMSGIGLTWGEAVKELGIAMKLIEESL